MRQSVSVILVWSPCSWPIYRDLAENLTSRRSIARHHANTRFSAFEFSDTSGILIRCNGVPTCRAGRCESYAHAAQGRHRSDNGVATLVGRSDLK